MAALLTPVVFLAVAAYSISYLIVAFASESTVWWWWFVPVYGTIKIFGAGVLLGIFHVGILFVVFLGGWLVEEVVGA